MDILRSFFELMYAASMEKFSVIEPFIKYFEYHLWLLKFGRHIALLDYKFFIIS